MEVFIGNLSINGAFSIAKFDYQRVIFKTLWNKLDLTGALDKIALWSPNFRLEIQWYTVNYVYIYIIINIYIHCIYIYTLHIYIHIIWLYNIRNQIWLCIHTLLTVLPLTLTKSGACHPIGFGIGWPITNQWPTNLSIIDINDINMTQLYSTHITNHLLIGPTTIRITRTILGLLQ